MKPADDKAEGAYDDICTEARRKANAMSCLLCIIDGDHGSGFSVQATPEHLAQIVRLLRYTADRIESGMSRPFKVSVEPNPKYRPPGT